MTEIIPSYGLINFIRIYLAERAPLIELFTLFGFGEPDKSGFNRFRAVTDLNNLGGLSLVHNLLTVGNILNEHFACVSQYFISNCLSSSLEIKAYKHVLKGHVLFYAVSDHSLYFKGH